MIKDITLFSVTSKSVNKQKQKNTFVSQCFKCNYKSMQISLITLANSRCLCFRFSDYANDKDHHNCCSYLDSTAKYDSIRNRTKLFLVSVWIFNGCILSKTVYIIVIVVVGTVIFWFWLVNAAHSIILFHSKFSC